MKKDATLYSIKEFAELTNVSTDTLRYYHKLGLLVPSHINKQNGYRYYSLLEFEEIGVIQVLQSLGVPLEIIKDYLKNRTFFTSYQFLTKQYNKISIQVEELLQLKNYLGEKLDAFQSIITNTDAHDVILKELPTRIGYGNTVNCSNYQEIKIESAKIIEKYNKNLFMSNSYGLYIPIEDLYNGNYSEHYYCAIIGIERSETPTIHELHFDRGTYATIQFNGNSFQREPALVKVMQYIKEHNYQIAGDALQVCIVDENITNIDSEKVSEIQIRLQ